MLPVIFFHTHFAKAYLTKNLYGKLYIYLEGASIVVDAFVDTGNHLYEPITGLPVCLVEYEKIKNYIHLEKMKDRLWSIPYHTIGKKDGRLCGITADKVIFQNKWRKIIKSGCIVALYMGNLTQSGEYSGIVHPDILEK